MINRRWINATIVTILLTTGAAGQSIGSASGTYTIGHTSLPSSPWMDQDIGNVGSAGSASVSNGVFTLRGAGNNIDDDNPVNDGYHIVYQSLNGDGAIVARMTSMSGGKAGVMIRETLDPGALNAFTGIYQGSVWFFETRATAGAPISNPNGGGISVPYWVKVVRQGNAFSGYISADGVAWTQVGSTVTLNMAANVYMGLVATSLSSSTLGTVTFDNVSASDSAHDFQISAAPVTGSSTNFTVSVTAGSSFSGSIGLSVAGLPSGATAAFSPATLSGTGTSTLTITPGTAAAGSYTLTVTGSTASLGHAATVRLTVGTPLPPPWVDQDIGAVGHTGSAAWAGGTFTLSGAGNNIDDDNPLNDGYHIVYQLLNGDGAIVARVASMSGGKAGVMIRERLDPGALNAFTGIYQGSVWFFETRATVGAPISNPNGGGISVPYWVKVVRQGNAFSGYISSNGVAWTQVGSTVTLNMAANVYVGFVATSLASSTLGTATFDNVSASDSAHDFQISASPVVGSNTNFTVSITAGSSFTGSIALSVAGLPSGATAGFAPPTLNGTGNSTLTVTPGTATPGSYTLTITGTAGSLSHTATVRLTVGTPLPSPWVDQDIGAVGSTGSATWAAGTFTVQGAGNNIDDDNPLNDGYHIVYQSLNGDGTIVARVASMSGGKAGVMIRQTLDPGALNAFTGVYQGSVWFFETRATAGAPISNPNGGGISVPYWFKVVRQGNGFSGYISANGVSWTQVGSTVTLNMTANVYVGLVASSLSSGTLGTATFDNVSVSDSAHDFQISAAAVTGSSNNFTVTVTAGASFTGSIGLSVAGLPTGATAAFSPATLSGTGTSTLTITPGTAAVGSYTLTITGSTGSLSHAATVRLTLGTPLPAPWVDQDIGVGQAGSASVANGVFTVQGSGNNIDDDNPLNDGYHIVYQSLNGDGAIVARVGSMSGGKAGVMIRETLDPGALNAFTGIYQGSVWFFETRATAGAPISNPNGGGISVPYWVKVVRQGNAFSGYISSNGVAWTQVGSTVTLNMATNVYMGLVGSSLSSATLGTATFDNMSASDSAHDFQISAAAVTGSSTNYTISVTAGVSFTGSIGLSVAGLPTGATAAFSPATLSGTGTSTLAITPGSAAAGSYTLTITASGGSAVHLATMSLTVASQSAKPTFSPAAGSYTSAQNVTISTATSGASIRYTTDGSTPSETAGTVYVSPFTVSATTTVRAIAYASGALDSMVNAATYTIVPNIASVSPATGTAGMSVTISGSGFGPAQGKGSVWLGSTNAAVVSWSDTQVVASVAPNATSGTAQVRQGGVWSNAVPFNVKTPTILTVSPVSGVSGTQVTITGSGFGAAQGGGQVWLGSAIGVVQSWSDTQVVALVGSGSTSGKAQVLQGGVMSNTVPFTVNSLHITSVSPGSGSSGTSVTITGTGFGASQGTGSVLLGSTNGQVVSWSDTQVVATVAAGALTGVVRVQQNGLWSNALTFTVPGGTVTLVPNVLNLVVGDTRTIQARGSNGQSVTGLTWTSSNTNVVSLSTSDPPILTALAAGHITITAGAASADVTVFSGALPLGTVIWSAPGAVSKILPAVPSPSGVADVFALQNDGTVQAITSDGITVWTADVSQAAGWVLPDFRGGLVAPLNKMITTFDGLTGQPYSPYAITNPDQLLESLAVHTDGTIFAHVSNRGTSGYYSLMVGIDPSTGAQKFSITLPNPDAASAIIVAGDGYAYMAYGYEESSNAKGHLKVLRVDSSGASTQISVFDWSGPPPGDPFPFNGQNALISNADQGVLLSWWDLSGKGAPVLHWTAISGTGMTDASGPGIAGQTQAPISPVLQLQDGSFVGLAMVGDRWATFDQLVPYMVAFDATGSVRWSVANEQPQIATQDGGIIGKSGITYDQNGNATGQIQLATQSWIGNDYQLGSVEQIVSAPILFAVSFAAFQGGNPSSSGTFVPSLGAIFRANVASIAKGYVGDSTDWRETNGTTCNLFVRDCLIQASNATQLKIPFPTRPNLTWYQSNFRHPFLAADWANPSINGGCWKPLPAGPNGALPGDVIATGYPLGGNDGTGHVGIVVPPNIGFPNYIDASAGDVAPYFWTSAQKQSFIAGTITLTDYGFRLPGFDSNDPTNVQGLKQDSRVRRFACY